MIVQSLSETSWDRRTRTDEVDVAGDDVERSMRSLDRAAAAAAGGLRARTVRVVALVDRAPHARAERIARRLAVADQAARSAPALTSAKDRPGRGFADAHALPGEVLAEADIVVGQAAKLELGHRLLLRGVSADGTEARRTCGRPDIMLGRDEAL